MEIIIRGKLIDCVKNMSADGKKEYYSLNIYSNGTMHRVGVTRDLYDHYINYLDQEVEVSDISLWVEGKYSLYIRG